MAAQGPGNGRKALLAPGTALAAVIVYESAAPALNELLGADVMPTLGRAVRRLHWPHPLHVLPEWAPVAGMTAIGLALAAREARRQAARVRRAG